MLVHGTDGSDGWTVIAADREGLRRAREVIRAFVGPAVAELSTSTVDRELHRPGGESDPVLCAAVHVAKAAGFREAAERMVLVRASTPARSSQAAATIAQLLRDFRLALHGHDIHTAEDLLDRIRRDGRLSGENLRFLQVELCGEAGRWTELRNLDWFLQVARSSRPRLITEIMIEAIWRTEFIERGYFEPTAARTHYTQIPPDFLKLFDAVDVPTYGGARRLVALRALDQGSADRVARLREHATEDERSWIDALDRATDPTVELDDADKARRMLDDGRYADVVALAVSSPDDVTVLQAAVRAVFEAEDRQLAISLRPLLTDEARQALPTTPGFARYLQGVESLTADQCTSWLQWIIRTADTPPWPAAVDVITDSAATWSTEELLGRDTAEPFAAHLMDAATGVNAEYVEASMYLLCGLAADIADAPGASDIIDTVLSVLMQYEPTKPLGEAFLRLVHAVLDAGPTTKRYQDLLDVCLGAQQLFSTPVLLPVALDLLDEVATHPAPDPSKRLQLATCAHDGLTSLAHVGHLNASDARLAQLLLTQLGLEGIRFTTHDAEGDAEAAAEVDPWQRLVNRKVFLYTLADSFGARFTQQLRELCPSATVQVRADHDASKPLREAARNADYVIVDWRRAKHAATGAIDEVRPKSQQVLPEGTGVSSFLRSLQEALQ